MHELESVVFFIRAYNDIDHFTPLLAEFIRRDEKPIVVVTTDVDYSNDYRFQYLHSLGELEVILERDEAFILNSTGQTFYSRMRAYFYRVTRKRGVLGMLLRRLFFNCAGQMKFLRENNVSACVFEWCSPFERGTVIEKYFVAAKGMGITTFSIPHGCNVFINSDANVSYRDQTLRGYLHDAKDRNYFDYFVLQNPIRRAGWVKWGHDPAKTQAWGSLRFYPRWAKINQEICPKYEGAKIAGNKMNVVFMQFQKDYNIDNIAVLEFLRYLSNISDINLIVKDATREGKSFYNKAKETSSLGESLISWFGNEVHSPSLITWSDCVVVIGGSIGIEAMLQGKPVIYPTHLNSNRTMYEYFDAAHCVSSTEELNPLLSKIHRGEAECKRAGIDALISEIVYAGGAEFDVPAYYYSRIKQRGLNY